jgi:hypothetical protein
MLLLLLLLLLLLMLLLLQRCSPPRRRYWLEYLSKPLERFGSSSHPLLVRRRRRGAAWLLHVHPRRGSDRACPGCLESCWRRPAAGAAGL